MILASTSLSAADLARPHAEIPLPLFDTTDPPQSGDHGSAIFAEWDDSEPTTRVHATYDTTPPGETASHPGEKPPTRPFGDARRDEDTELAAAPGSLLGARIAGARSLLKDAAAEDDDTLLFAANAVHHKAKAQPDDAEAQSESMALWRAEAAAWASANGADAALEEETRLQAYLDLWSLALDPPHAPDFDDRRQLALRYVLERAKSGLSIAIASEPSPTPVPLEKLLDHYMKHPEVIARYYGQFAAYVQSHLERFSKLSATSEAAAVGLNRLRLEEKPGRIWHLKDVSAMQPGTHVMPSGSMRGGRRWPLPDVHVAQMNHGGLFLIDATGRIEPLHGDFIDDAGGLRVYALLRKIGGDADGNGDGDSGSSTPANGAAAPASAVRRHAVKCESREPVRLGAYLAALRQDAIRAAMEQWKEEKYLPSRTESIMRMVVPFYKVYHDMRWDPGYRLRFEDIAWDAAQLTLTVLGVALTAVAGTAGVAATVAAIRAAAGQGITAMIKAGALSIMRRFSLRTLLVQGTRELVDFVIPVFSAARIVRGTAHLAPATGQALRTAVRRADGILRQADPKPLLDGIYEAIARGGGAGRQSTPAVIRETMEAAAARPIPGRIYRGHTGTSLDNRLHAAGSDATQDDILIACIRHTSALGGSNGRVMSLTSDRSVAIRFGKSRPQPHLYTIDTTPTPGKFRTIEDILLKDGPRLVQEAKIKPGTLRSAILNALVQEESEIFYIGSILPDELIDSITPLNTATRSASA